jgi:SsrA-binding protein
MAIENRRARFDYALTDFYEAGIMLVGSEVKSLRKGGASINEAFVVAREGDLYLVNATIAHYSGANQFNHDTKRDRKLLLKAKEIKKIIGALTKDRMTLVPTRLFFNDKGRVKCQLGLGKGKKLVDKRESIKERDWERQKRRADAE